MDHSPFFTAIRTGKWPKVMPNLSIAGHKLKRFFFLVDGIYPRYPIFALPFVDLKSRKENMYARRHSSARKAVERVFGVLFRQFRILCNPCRLCHLKDMHYVVNACIILHNIIADRRGYAVTMKFREELDAVSEKCDRLEAEQIHRVGGSASQGEGGSATNGPSSWVP